MDQTKGQPCFDSYRCFSLQKLSKQILLIISFTFHINFADNFGLVSYLLPLLGVHLAKLVELWIEAGASL